MTDRTEINLPLPNVTVNGAYTNKAEGGRAKSKGYKDWLKAAGTEWMIQRNNMLRQGIPLFTYNCGVKITLEVTDQVSRHHRPENKARDLMNHEKMTTDFLVKHGILVSDTLVDEYAARWNSEIKGVRITIEPA